MTQEEFDRRFSWLVVLLAFWKAIEILIWLFKLLFM